MTTEREKARDAATSAGPEDRTQQQAGRTIARPDASDNEPEHRNDRRRFLMWCCMLNVVPPQRVVERIVAEVNAEAAS